MSFHKERSKQEEIVSRRKAIFELFNLGKTDIEIAESLSVSKETVQKDRQYIGIKRYKKKTSIDNEKLKSLREAGNSRKDIAAELGIKSADSRLNNDRNRFKNQINALNSVVALEILPIKHWFSAGIEDTDIIIDLCKKVVIVAKKIAEHSKENYRNKVIVNE